MCGAHFGLRYSRGAALVMQALGTGHTTGCAVPVAILGWGGFVAGPSRRR